MCACILCVWAWCATSTYHCLPRHATCTAEPHLLFGSSCKASKKGSLLQLGQTWRKDAPKVDEDQPFENYADNFQISCPQSYKRPNTSRQEVQLYLGSIATAKVWTEMLHVGWSWRQPSAASARFASNQTRVRQHFEWLYAGHLVTDIELFALERMYHWPPWKTTPLHHPSNQFSVRWGIRTRCCKLVRRPAAQPTRNHQRFFVLNKILWNISKLLMFTFVNHLDSLIIWS